QTARIPEAVVARIWNDGLCSRELRTTDGQRVAIVYRGVWTHSNGPDFRDAMLEIAGRLVTGSVELHVDSRDWFVHGHHDNPAYVLVLLPAGRSDVAGHAAHGPPSTHTTPVVLSTSLTTSIKAILSKLQVVNNNPVTTITCLAKFVGARPPAFS